MDVNLEPGSIARRRAHQSRASAPISHRTTFQSNPRRRYFYHRKSTFVATLVIIAALVGVAALRERRGLSRKVGCPGLSCPLAARANAPHAALRSMISSSSPRQSLTRRQLRQSISTTRRSSMTRSILQCGRHMAEALVEAQPSVCLTWRFFLLITRQGSTCEPASHEPRKPPGSFSLRREVAVALRCPLLACLGHSRSGVGKRCGEKQASQRVEGRLMPMAVRTGGTSVAAPCSEAMLGRDDEGMEPASLSSPGGRSVEKNWQ